MLRTSHDSKGLKGYSTAKKLQIFAALKKVKFDGQLSWQAQNNQRWNFFICKGRLIYGVGGVHPIRQWYRQVKQFCPGQDVSPEGLYRAVSAITHPILPACAEYHLLYSWMQQGRINDQTFEQIIHTTLVELLFEILQAGNVKYQLYRKSLAQLDLESVTIHEEQLLQSTKSLWEDWMTLGLGQYSPNLAPVIRQPERLRSEVSPKIFELLTQLLDGQQSLRDLAAKARRDIVQFLQVLEPYIQRGTIELIEVADYPKFSDLMSNKGTTTARKTPLIACIDDSLMVCQTVGQVLKSAGYDYISITEGAKAIKTLLLKKPDAVFLDLVMPDTNGYEICGQLRKMSAFQETPIIILSGNDGLVDQVRARLLGATDFLSKPVEPIVILSILQKYLKNAVSREAEKVV